MLLRIAVAVVITALSHLTYNNAATPPIFETLAPGTYNADYGVFIGKFINSEFGNISGTVYAINDTAIQIVNFIWNGKTRDTFFWLDSNNRPTKDGFRVPTFEYGISPIGEYGTARVVLIIPNELKILNFKSLSLFSTEDNVTYGTIRIPETLIPPKTQILSDELQGSRYHISGVVQVIDTKTIRIIGFSFEGHKAPDGYFFVGQGLNVTRDSGAKAAIRGRDTPDMILPMNERYTGGKDIYVELVNGYDIQHIDFLAVYSIRFDVVYASILLKNISRYSIPPFIPPQKSYEIAIKSVSEDAWILSNLLGTSLQKNFTFQLGPAGGKRGYQAMHNVARPPHYVWYVNGYLANLYLKRGETYNFIVEGGRNATIDEYNNPLYLTNDSYGGFTKLTNLERQTVKIFAPNEPQLFSSGRLCRWTSSVVNKQRERRFSKPMNNFNFSESDVYSSFTDFRATLKLTCDGNDEPAVFEFTPSADTPNVLFFQSYNNHQMGSKIFIVNEFPADLKYIVEEPYQYEAWRHQDNLELARESGSVSAFPQIRNVLVAGLFIIFSSVFLF